MVCSTFSRRMVLLALGVVLALPAFAKADDGLQALQMSVLKSCGMVITPNSSGSAFVIDTKEKLLLTHYQVVRGQEQISVIFPWYQDGKLIADMKIYIEKGVPTKARVLGTNSSTYFALRQVEITLVSLGPVMLATLQQSAGDKRYVM